MMKMTMMKKKCEGGIKLRGKIKSEYSCHQSYESEGNTRHAAKSLYYPSLVVA